MQTPQETAKKPRRGQFMEGNTASRGRPKGSVSITAAIRKKLTQRYPHSSNTEKRTYLEVIVKTILDKALEERDTATLKQIWNYMDGLPKSHVAIDVDRVHLAEMTDYFRKMATPSKETSQQLSQ